MNAIQKTLPGRSACMETIRHAIQVTLRRHGRIERIELRYSSQAARPFDSDAVRKAIYGQLREAAGTPRAQVSIRQMDLPLEDALGDHLLRIYPAPAAAPKPGPLARVIAKILALWNQPAPEPTAQRQEPAGVVGLPPRAAVELLNAAIDLGAVDFAAADAPVPAHLLITVRNAALHATLKTQVCQNLAASARYVAQRLQSRGVEVPDDLRLSYVYAPRAHGDRTEYIDEGDIDLSAASDAETVGPAQDGTLYESQCATLAEGDTAPPLVLIVRGSNAGVRAEPVQIALHSLPARIDRNTFTAAGVRDEGLRLVSRSHALVVDRNGQGGISLRAAGLPAAAAPYLQVNGQYRRLDGDWNDEARSLSLLLSRPGGALDPDTGRRVLPLELELRLG